MYAQASLNSQDLFKETILPEQILIWSGIYNTCIWIRSPIPIKHYLLIVNEFFSELKVSCGLSNNNHCKLLMANVLQWKQGPILICRLWWGWSHTVVGHLFWNVELLFHKEICILWIYTLITKIKSISPSIVKKIGDN
jgi:hypothetical protein